MDEQQHHPVVDDDEMITIGGVCRFWGGEEKPLHPATIYRWIKAGIHPPPERLGPNTRRWSKRKLLAARAAA
jgi:hypothetical protein